MENLKVSETFRTAAIKSDLRKIKESMKCYPSKNFGKELAWAAGAGLLNVVKCLVDNGADIEYNKGLPLNYSVVHKRFAVVKYLIHKGANVNSRRKPLHEAILSENRQMVKYLLEFGAKIIFDTELIEDDAIRLFDLDILKLIIKNSPLDEDDLDYFLWSAAEYGKFKIVKYLISLGAEPCYDGIGSAIEGRKYVVSSYLIDYEFSKDPSLIKEYEDLLSGRQRKKYAHLLAVANFNI